MVFVFCAWFYYKNCFFLSNTAQFNHNRHKGQVVKICFCGYLTVFCVSPWAVPVEPGQDEFLNTQKHPGSSRSSQTANGVQGGPTGSCSPFSGVLVFSFSFFLLSPDTNCIFPPDPASPIPAELKFGSRYAAKQRWVHWIWRHPQRWEPCPSFLHLQWYVCWHETIAYTVLLSFSFVDPAHSEVMGEPHMMVEYKLGLLWTELGTQIHIIMYEYICLSTP